ncbi:MAG: adenylyl cyclase class-3/4/guanylyl cyclase [Nocardioides sp.]|uniref:adenylate/guanylate cyclase domain-containing protein n=1 Tax=Nocardioides sp. TaxID=35761 RepID=UPI00262FE40E|nr:adenylate/guanylate cyclase domain-containing protein [Nocardioides sp.]MCW2835823.1 adenylyl cyclase class-3/4/guanylyl cyclase [Nocardioides sp.]
MSDSGDLGNAFDTVEAFLLGGSPTLTRVEVAKRAGVPLEVAQELWRLLGFAHVNDEVVAFTESDVQALRLTADLMDIGILGPDSQAALVRTWGRSYARLAEWQTSLLAGHAVEGPDPDVRLAELVTGVLPRVEALQSYVWRRHLTSAASRLLSTGSASEAERTMAVCFVDIVGYTTRSKSLEEDELVVWIENFEQVATGTVVDHGGRVIKTIGDEIMFTTDDPAAATEIALSLTQRGLDQDDPFPDVRAGIAYGLVVNRLGDVYGATVNVASRLTSVARPGTVVIDGGAHAALSDDGGADASDGDPDRRADDGTESPGLAGTEHVDQEPAQRTDPDLPAYRFRRLRRVSVKGYSRLEAWRVQRPKED